MKKIIYFILLLVVIGTVFVFTNKDQYVEAPTQSIFLEQPFFEQYVESPLLVKGKAAGSWFFEGDFPVILFDKNEKIIAEGYVTAQENWMTEELVLFEGFLIFEKPQDSDRGIFMLKKNNPSGLLENDEVLEIPILFR